MKPGYVQGNLKKLFKDEKRVNNYLKNREWISVMTAVYFIHEIVEHYYEFEAILDAVEFVIIPVANPDGYVYTQTNRQWNKNRQATANPACPGVDVNANFRQAFLSGSDVS